MCRFPKGANGSGKKLEGGESEESQNTLMMKWLLYGHNLVKPGERESTRQTFEWQQKSKTEQSLEMPRRTTLMKVMAFEEEAGESTTEKFQNKNKKKNNAEKMGSAELVLFGGSAWRNDHARSL